MRMALNESASEEQLLALCRRRDQEAFGRLVDAYYARVFGFVRRLVRNDDDALDVTQDVFVKAFQHVDRFDGRCSVRTWLFRIAYNLCVDRSRKLHRAPGIDRLDGFSEEEETIEVGDSRWDPERVALTDELLAVVEDALGTMSEKLRAVLLLHDREELGYEEIAQAMEIPVGTVKSRLFLAREHLQKAVGRYMKFQEGV